MPGYFDLLRQHQKEPLPEPPASQEPESVPTSDDVLLISEDQLPSEIDPSPPPLEDDLLCEEEGGDTTEVEKAPPEAEVSSTEIPAAPVVSNTPTPSATTKVEDEPPKPSSSPVSPVTTPQSSEGTPHTDEDQVSTHIAEWLQSFIAIIHSMFQHCRRHEPHDMKPLEKHITNLLLWLERDTQLINSLELELELADFKQYAHDGQDDLIQLIMKSVMMLLYCLKTTAELKSPHDMRVRLVMASVLQHIGMAQIPPEILGKKGRLSPDELAEIREAPARGKAYLQSCGIEDEYLLRAADESNERVDGSGPRGLQGKDICYSARLTGLLSMFEAMIHMRSYRKRMLPREAVRVVVQKFKPAFEHAMLKALLDAISLYPIGSFVKLNSKEIGKVISCHPRLPLRPQVRITMDEYGNEIPPREIDLKKHPNLMIEQCAYEDDIQSLMHEEKS